MATSHRDLQEDPVHPDLYLKIYQQQERELEQRLMHRLAAQGRSAGIRSRLHLPGTHRPHRRATNS